MKPTSLRAGSTVLSGLAGDHYGLDGLSSLFGRLREASDTGFHNEPH